MYIHTQALAFEIKCFVLVYYPEMAINVLNPIMPSIQVNRKKHAHCHFSIYQSPSKPCLILRSLF